MPPSDDDLAGRRRRQQWFEHGSKMAGKGDFDYATTMFTQCVQGDPGNVVYVQSFLGNLQKKYNNNKKGGKLAGARGLTTRGAIKKSTLQKDWKAVLGNGLEILKLNPWDTTILTAMATACEHLEYDESQLAYLKLALEVDIKDPEVNRLYGKALARLGRFDESIVCWTRVRQANPSDEEARRMIANLTVEKTIHKGGYEDAESSTEVMADKDAQAQRQGSAGPRLTPEQVLEKAIAKNPGDVSNYTELADLHLKHERYEQAETMLAKALQVSSGDLNIQERLEDVQIRRAKEQLAIAHQKAAAERTPEAQALYKKLWDESNKKELEIYRGRSDRYPSNLGLKYELGVRLKRAKNYNEAIKVFQEVRGDPKRKGAVFLDLGECFQAIKQYKLAMTNYEAAVADISERDMDLRKLSMYRAGKLALFMKDLEVADKHLSALAGLDFGYKDVAALLDKLNQLRDDGGSDSLPPE
jgi:tetratricopeptide (TPR) repeat protein